MTPSVNADGLLTEVRSCTICKDLPLGARPIVQFSPSSRLLIVGQAPGRITHERGIPFDDPSGDRLRAWLGIDRDVFYDARKVAIVPMGFCFPGTANGGDLPPRSECAPAWRNRILDILTSVELTLVIGRYAIDWHLPQFGRSTVTDAVKSWADVWPNRLILPHPSPRNNRWLRQNPWFENNIVPVLQTRVENVFDADRP
ncbi:uracil-DNA glycosylase family protein [Hoeflea prorocentri]|uniref:Uracil-DNA glycosylase family protein n=1 Tax=Hoeflea prorocentri TaxID=1922333 RepID=A0A9X3UIR8_9HYPH|nr:uracil-DNA glycosylase family protein [Hoeflea prorocentri]MCY6382097.1 uracil-DNA glycosylase family protein [Hoeflea prorocentri]MDA5399897.1 uracil-DNA glycosylase family protein [Hoeflea prorocentri]